MKITAEYEGLVRSVYGYYEYNGDIITRESLEIEVPIIVKGKIEAGNWIEAGDWIEMSGVKTKTLFILHGTFRFTVWVMDDHIKIGCKLKTKVEWLKVTTKEQALSLGDDGSMWALRDLLKKLCE